MNHLLFKLGVCVLIGALNLLSISCGSESQNGDTEKQEQLSKKAWKDITSILGRWNSNRKCGNNKNLDDCNDRKQSGELRFVGNRSGCAWRGDKCQVNCGRIAKKSLCTGGFGTTAANECEWNEQLNLCYGSDDATSEYLVNEDIKDEKHLSLANSYCKRKGFSNCGFGCEIKKGICQADCLRIVNREICPKPCVWHISPDVEDLWICDIP